MIPDEAMKNAGIVAYRLAIVAAVLLVPSWARAELTSSPKVAAAREAFAACARANLKTLETVDGAMVAGLAFFVGLSCASAREDYRAALKEAGANDVDRMMQAIDARTIDFILDDWANMNAQKTGNQGPKR